MKVISIALIISVIMGGLLFLSMRSFAPEAPTWVLFMGAGGSSLLGFLAMLMAIMMDEAVMPDRMAKQEEASASHE